VADSTTADPFRRRYQVRTPSGQRLTAEHDLLRHHWRIIPGEYTRRRLADALAQATGARPDADWIKVLEKRISRTQSE
jgi:hypothetical protein